MIEVRGLKKAFGDLVVFDDLELKIDHPGIYVISGPSGCGKSTLLQVLAGREACNAESIDIKGKIGLILQNYDMIDEIKVIDNIYLKRSKDPYTEMLIDKLGIRSLCDRYPKELSGGQRQRVGIIRTISFGPDIIMCDEPTESLDIHNKEIVMDLFKKLSRSKIIILVSHDQDLYERYADTIYLFEDNKLVMIKDEKGDLDIKYERPRSLKGKEIKALIKEVFFKRKLLFLTSIAILIILIIGAFYIDQHLFTMGDSDLRNKDMYYIVTTNTDIIEDNNLKLVIPFEALKYQGQDYAANIYPSLEALPELSVIINKNLADSLNIHIDDEIELVYDVFGNERSVKVKVSDIIEEKGTNIRSVYYDLDKMMTYFSKEKVSDTLSMSDYFDMFSNTYQYHYDYEGYDDLYYRLSDIDEDIKILNPLHDERVKIAEDSQVYRMVFILAIGFLIILATIFIIVFIRSNDRRFKYVLAVISTFGADFDKAKSGYRNYILAQALWLILIMASITVMSYIVMHYDLIYVLIMVIIMIVWLIIYLIIVIYLDKDLKISDLNTILKDS